jgi:hypothetical protein
VDKLNLADEKYSIGKKLATRQRVARKASKNEGDAIANTNHVNYT